MENEKIDECRMKQKLVSALLSAKADNEGLTAFKTVLYGEFLEFANSENALSNEAEMILSLQEIERDLELISAYPRLHTKNVVAVGGGFSAGKSEFISSFIRSGIRLPVGVVPTTAIPTYVFHEETEKILGCSGKGGVVELNEIDENFQAKLSHDFIKSFDFNLKEIMPYMMIGSRIDHTHICFIDTPGYNPASVSDGFTHEDVKTARDFLESANALVWLIGADAHGTVSASDLEFLSGLDLEEKPLYIVYNKADLRSPDDLEEILDAIGESLEDEDLAFEGISAYSSVTGEEYLHVGRSLDEFLRDCDVYANKHIEIHRRLKYVHDAYKEATEAKIAEKKEIARRLRSLSFDTYEEGVELDRKPHEAIESLKKLFSTRTEEIDLQRLEEIFGRMKESVDRVFGRSVDFDFNKIEDKRKKRKPFPSSAHGKLPISEHAKNRESGHEETKRLRCADPTGASGRNVGTRESRNGDEERLYPVKEGERYGYMNIRGEWRIEPTFQAADDFAANALAKIQRDGRWGLIDKRGETVLEPAFDDIGDFSPKGLAKIRRDDKWGLVDERGDVVLEPVYDDIGDFSSSGLARVERNDKWGLIDERGDVVLEPVYDDIGDFSSRGPGKTGRKGVYGLVNEKKGQGSAFWGFFSSKERLETIELDDEEKCLVNARGEMVSESFFDGIVGHFMPNGLAWIERDGAYGLIDEKGEVVLEPAFETIVFLPNGLVKIERNGRWGLIDEKGGMVFEPIYDRIVVSSNGLAKIQRNGKWGLVDGKGEMILESVFSEIGEFSSNGLARVERNGKYGLIDEQGRMLLEPVFDYIDFSSNGLAWGRRNGKWSLVDERGEVVLEPAFDFDDVYSFSPNGLAEIEHNGKYGLIDEKGEIVLEPVFDEIYRFSSNGLAKIERNGKYGLIDEKGEVVLEPVFDKIYRFSPNGLAKIRCNDKYGLIDEQGGMVLEPVFDYIGDFSSNGLAWIKRNGEQDLVNEQGEMDLESTLDKLKLSTIYFNYFNELKIIRNSLRNSLSSNGRVEIERNGQWGLIDERGEMVLEPAFDFDDVDSFSPNGLAEIRRNGKSGLIDERGEIVLEPVYDDIYSFSPNGLAEIEHNGKHGLIDEKGEVVLEPVFNSLHFLPNGLVKIRRNGKYGLVDEKGEVILEPAFDGIGDFSPNGLAEIERNGKRGLIDEKGEIVLEPVYDGIGDFSPKGLVKIRRNGKYGLVDERGEEIVEPAFDYIGDFFADGVARVELGGKWGLIDEKGEAILSPRFDTLRYDSAHGFVEVGVNGKYGLVDRKGEAVLLPLFDGIRIYEDVIRVRFGDREGLVSHEGEYLTFDEEDLKF